MPAGAVGSVWASGSWSTTAWETETWADAGAAPSSVTGFAAWQSAVVFASSWLLAVVASR